MGAILGFLGKFSIKQYIYAGIAMLALTLAMKGFNALQAHFAKVENLRQANQELVIQNAAFEVERKSNEIVMNALQIAMETQAEAINIITTEFSTAREESEKQKRVLDSSRLRRIAADRAATMERLSNAATAERLKEMEGVINEDFQYGLGSPLFVRMQFIQ